MEEATLEDGAIGIVVRFNSVFRVFVLDKSKAFSFPVALLERNMDLLALAADRKAVVFARCNMCASIR
jgi:hypothetical protein